MLRKAVEYVEKDGTGKTIKRDALVAQVNEDGTVNIVLIDTQQSDGFGCFRQEMANVRVQTKRGQINCVAALVRAKSQKPAKK